jgi:predicted DNA-binding protein
MSNDALERLKKRQRPSVPSRDASVSASADISTSGYQESSSVDISTSGYQESLSVDISTSGYQEAVSQESGSLDIPTSQQQDSQVSRQDPEQLLTKQTTLRLEASLSQRLSEVCQNNGISREVLLEALFEHYSNDPEAWQAILAQAKRRGERRMQMANLKRAKSMMQRFGS